MADFGTVVGVIASILGIITACFASYLAVTRPTGLIETAERVRLETREYLQNVFADGLLEERFLFEVSKKISSIELDIMELHGVLYDARPWYKSLMFWATTWREVRIACHNLKQVQADIAFHASKARKELHNKAPGCEQDPESAQSEELVIDDDGKTTTFDILDQLECGTLNSPPPSSADKRSVASRLRKHVLVMTNLKRCWSTVRAKVGASRTSKHETTSGEADKRHGTRRRRLTEATLVDPFEAACVEKKDDSVASPLPRPTPSPKPSFPLSAPPLSPASDPPSSLVCHPPSPPQ
ncbi:uncharacterized protein BXZ73DRAFT_76833 [Epithele typhae]|uniref:uncharacterized protein n=1 Tax=Epithele typhae TaxID=378194 RepID=UPI002008142B|nr:uncharacterized protein BXZ73DRAFT_76833 [Epithele typhae]KAH9935122.1 hypothetical protein BXZ73DRAFT_76833 [Epithele typhae]